MCIIRHCYIFILTIRYCLITMYGENVFIRRER